MNETLGTSLTFEKHYKNELDQLEQRQLEIIKLSDMGGDTAKMQENLFASFAELQATADDYYKDGHNDYIGDVSIYTGGGSTFPEETSAMQRRAAENEAWKESGASYYDGMRGSVWGDLGANAGTYAHDAGVAVYSGLQMLYDIGTDSKTRGQVWDGIKYTVSHPVQTYQGSVLATSDWMGKSTAEQMRTIGGGGLAFIATAGGEQLAAKSLEGIKATTFVMRSPLEFTPNPLGRLSGLGIPDVPKVKFRAPVVSIKTVTPEMQAAFKGNGYLNPLDNKLTALKWYEKNAVDHIYPVKEIKAMEGFDDLTPDQMRAILQDKVELGNLQPLPTSLNSSKGAKIDWTTFLNKKFDGVYAQDLIIQQQEIARRIQKQILTYQQINRAAGIK